MSTKSATRLDSSNLGLSGSFRKEKSTRGGKVSVQDSPSDRSCTHVAWLVDSAWQSEIVSSSRPRLARLVPTSSGLRRVDLLWQKVTKSFKPSKFSDLFLEDALINNEPVSICNGPY